MGLLSCIKLVLGVAFHVYIISNFLCRYKASPEEVAASCDITFAMLADPESAVSMPYFLHLLASCLLDSVFSINILLGRCCLWKAWSC